MAETSLNLSTIQIQDAAASGLETNKNIPFFFIKMLIYALNIYIYDFRPLSSGINVHVGEFIHIFDSTHYFLLFHIKVHRFIQMARVGARRECSLLAPEA